MGSSFPPAHSPKAIHANMNVILSHNKWGLWLNGSQTYCIFSYDSSTSSSNSDYMGYICDSQDKFSLLEPLAVTFYILFFPLPRIRRGQQGNRHTREKTRMRLMLLCIIITNTKTFPPECSGANPPHTIQKTHATHTWPQGMAYRDALCQQLGRKQLFRAAVFLGGQGTLFVWNAFVK